MVFSLISDTADLRPSIKKNAKSNQKASSDAAFKDAALNHQWLSENAALNDELTKALGLQNAARTSSPAKQLTWGCH